jgi:hypothetical protein
MPTTATAITTTPDSLMDQVKNMRSQLEIERRLTRHYRDLLLEAQRPSILSSASRLSRAQPTFSPASEKLLNNTAASLTGVITAFRMGYMVLHRHHRFSLDPDVGARFWVHFTTYLPDDFRKSVGSRDDSYLVDALEYAVTFAHGAHGVNHLDLADHFASISFELVHLLVHVKDIVSKAHFAGRISTILGALSSFCRYSFRKSAHMSLLSLCDQLLTRFPVEVNNPELVVQFVCVGFTSFLSCLTNLHVIGFIPTMHFLLQNNKYDSFGSPSSWNTRVMLTDDSSCRIRSLARACMQARTPHRSFMNIFGTLKRRKFLFSITALCFLRSTATMLLLFTGSSLTSWSIGAD